MPLRQYIEHIYFKRFGKERPDVVLSIEEKIRGAEEKRTQTPGKAATAAGRGG